MTIEIKNAHDLKNQIGCGEVINSGIWKRYRKDFKKAIDFFKSNPDEDVFFDWQENEGKGLIMIESSALVTFARKTLKRPI